MKHEDLTSLAVESTMHKKLSRTNFLVQAALIGAFYTAITYAMAPLSYGPMQVRVSEALTVLPYFTPAAIPGVFIGCVISNIISPYGLIDLVCGSLATLLAAVGTYALRGKRELAPLPPVLINALVIGAMLYYAYGVNASLWVNVLWVGCGQLIACYMVGYPLLRILEKQRDIFE
ncbi:MAG: QueT transporter family protein [Clostridiales Family XIII bacterium]|jgi:uncharacterized membrane protein|nr:QueT transporter family protein [Clostridiales Family XIII bacterium]